MRLLGIDYGAKRVGLALSDTEGRLAFPKEVLVNDATLVDTIATIVADEGVEGIVLGESRNFQQEENVIMKKVRAFGTDLSLRLGIPVFYEPEFLTTAEAKHFEKPGLRDASAAAILLQSYLDKNNV